MNTLPPNPVPVITPPPPSSQPTVVAVTPAQVWSAAAQNIVIVACFTIAFMYGKIGVEVFIPSLLGVAGVDLLGRVKAKVAGGAAALALGSTGVIQALGKIPHIGAVLIALLAALGFAGCGAANQALPQAGAALNEAVRGYNVALQAYERACLPEPLSAAEAACVELKGVLTEVADGLNTVVDAYGTVNQIVQVVEE